MTPTGIRVVVALAGLLLLGLLGVLIAVFFSLEATRSEMRHTQRDVQTRVTSVDSGLQPLLGALEPLTSTARTRKLKAGVRNAQGAIATIPGIAGDTSEAVRLVALISSQLRGAELPQLTRSLTDGRLKTTLDDVHRLVGGLEDAKVHSQAICDRRLRGRAAIADGQLACAMRTLANMRFLLSSQRRLTRRSLEVQIKGVNLTRQVTRLLSDSLAIQREILGHVRSLDSKIP